MNRLFSRRLALKTALAAFGAVAASSISPAAAAGIDRRQRLFVPGYRSDLARDNAGTLLVDVPAISKVPDGWSENRTLLSVIDLASPGSALKRAAYPVSGHGVTVLPELNVGVFSGMEHDTIAGFDLDTLDMTAFARTLEQGWRFGGHPVPMPDGKHVAVAERHPAEPRSGDRVADMARLAGRVVIRDALTLAPVGRFSSYGIRPHEIQITDDGRYMVVANYGSTRMAGASDDDPGLPDPVAPGIAIIEIASGRLMSWVDGVDPLAELRHVAGKRLDRIFAITARMTSADDPAAAGLEEPDPGSDHGFKYLSSLPVRVAAGQAEPLLSDRAPVTRHGLSVLYDAGSDEILMTFPATHSIALFDGATGAVRKIIRTDEHGLRWPCGVALSPDGSHWHVTGYWNGLMTLQPGTQLIGGVSPVPKWWGHSHSVIG